MTNHDYKILIVDDEAAIRRLCVRSFQKKVINVKRPEVRTKQWKDENIFR